MAILTKISLLMDCFAKVFGKLSNNYCFQKQDGLQRPLAQSSCPWAFFFSSIDVYGSFQNVNFI